MGATLAWRRGKVEIAEGKAEREYRREVLDGSIEVPLAGLRKQEKSRRVEEGGSEGKVKDRMREDISFCQVCLVCLH